MKKLGVKTFQIAELQRNLFVRDALNQNHAIMLGMLLEAGEELPPIQVTADKIIVDGRHRTAGHELAGRKEIQAEVVQFDSEAEMIAYAYKANTGGSLPPTQKDTEHTIGILIDRKETIANIAVLLALPPSITRKFVNNVKSKRRRANLLDAASAVRDEGLSVPRAAQEHGVDPEDLKKVLGGRKRGRRAQAVGEIKKQLTYNSKSNSSKTASIMRQLTEQFDDGDIGQKELEEIFDHLESLQKKAHRTVSDWKNRLIAKKRQPAT